MNTKTDNQIIDTNENIKIQEIFYKNLPNSIYILNKNDLCSNLNKSNKIIVYN